MCIPVCVSMYTFVLHSACDDVSTIHLPFMCIIDTVNVYSVFYALLSSFVHRCGRTARMGLEGSAMVFLQPTEASYVEFLDLNQGVKLQRYSLEPSEGAKTVVPRARALAAAERLFDN